MSYQPEERYWTDYLRIALPVVGLLLMLGLFWYWASNVIGDSGNSDKPSPTNVASIINAQNPTASAASVVDVTAQTNPQPTGTTAAGAANSGPATESTTTAAANSATDNTTANSGGSLANSGNTSANSASSSDTANSASSTDNPSQFNNGDTVQTTSDGVNLRADHTTDSEALEPMTTGTQLNVDGPGVKDGNYVWIPVTDPTTGTSGFVADAFVELVQ